MYLRNELVMKLGQAGFEDIGAEGGYEHADPASDSHVLVFIAHKPA